MEKRAMLLVLGGITLAARCSGAVNASNTTVAPTSTTTTTVLAPTSTTASFIQPTTTTTTLAASTVAVPTTAAVPASGKYQAVVIEIKDMSTAEFAAKKPDFNKTLLEELDNYCGRNPAACTPVPSSRKRRAAAAFDTIYTLPGYPVQEASNLRVAFFVSSTEGTFLPKDSLLSVVTAARASLSAVLGREIVRMGRLYYTVKTNPTSGPETSARTRLVIVFTGIFLGVVVFTAICVGVICWCGRKADTKDDVRQVRPLTTSELQLVDK